MDQAHLKQNGSSFSLRFTAFFCVSHLSGSILRKNAGDFCKTGSNQIGHSQKTRTSGVCSSGPWRSIWVFCLSDPWKRDEKWPPFGWSKGQFEEIVFLLVPVRMGVLGDLFQVVKVVTLHLGDQMVEPPILKNMRKSKWVKIFPK